MYAEALDCLSHHEETCMQDDSSRIVTAVTSYMKKSRSWSYCLTRARDCNCGSYAVTALENVYLNPYTDAEVSCSHFGSVYEMVKKTDFDRCLPSDHTYVSTSLKLFWSTQSDVCMELEAKQEKEMFCPLVPAFSTSSDCVNNCDTQDNCSDTTKCCPNECGGMSCLEPLEEDPKKQEPKPGYCPVFPRDAVGICPVECEIDQQCPEGQKCCKNPCGGPVCVDALDKEPLKPLECGENVPVPGCLDNPCDVTTCPNYDNAECRTAYCGGCHAQFIVDGVDVTNLCEDPVPIAECDPDKSEGTEGPCEDQEPIAECDPDKSEGTEGPCEDQDMGEKYYFNKETGQCEVFGYAGCEGNSNRFDTQMDCLQTCKPTCHLPMEYGDCNSHMEVWYFDYEKEDCVMFNFSGCGGNANRFPTKEACQMACANVMKFESACEIVKEELMSVVDEYTPFVDSLTDKLQCKFMMSEYRDISKSMLSECRLSTRAAEIVAEVENKIDFDWSMCEMDEEGDDKEEEDEEEEDMKCDLGEVDTQCVLPEVNENYDCQNLANYVACVKSLTNGCNLFQLIDLHGILTDHIESLTESGVTCEIDIPDRSDDPLMPVLDCLMPFKSIVTDALVEKFVPYGNAEDMCGAAEAMRTCVYGIPNLYAKPQVWKMLKIADEMHEQFCSELSLPMPESALECYVCEDETDNEECLKEMETCPINKMMCMTRVNLNIDGYTITKGCGNPEMIGKYDSWILLKDGFFYQYGCPGKLCNKDLRKEDVEETDKENEDEKQDEEGENDAGELVEPSETCLYKNLEPIVSGVLMKLTTKWFMADSDQKAFCSGEDMNAELELTTIKDSCSEEIAGQIDKVHMMFESLIAMVCPQDVEDEPTDAQCDWRKCIGPIVPYLRSNGSENECVHIKRGFDCLDDLLTECSQDDRVAIANGVIKVIRTIKGPQYCDMDLNDKFCVASRIDPTTVCDVSSAQACLNVQTSPFDSATVVCQKKKTKYDCVHYYLTYCLDTVPEKQRFLNQVEGDKCEDDTVESTFDPSACEAYTERTCTPYAAMSDAIDFITDNLGESDNNVVCQNVDGKKNEITSVVEGCVSPLAAITHFSFFHGVSLLDCTSSSLSPLEDTPLFQCVQTFVYELAESFSDPTLGGYCGAFHAFSECLDNLDDFTLEADLLKEELAWFHGLAESCQNDTEDPTSPDQGNCNTALGGHCIISYGMMHLLGPLYPDMGKTTLCPLGFESQLDINCSPFYVSCDADSNQVKRLEDMRSNLATYWDSVNICDVPEEPKWPEPKPEPEEKCEPGSALSLMSHLGLALSQCIDDHSIKDRVCWSVHTIESEIMYHIAGCSEAIQGYVLLSWRETNELATHVCKQSEHIDTPLCVPQDYSNPTETCQPGKALSCLIDLEEKVFDFDSTEERFCGYLRQDLVCYLDYTSNCDGQIKELLNPLIKVKLRQFEGRCKNTWCPIIVEPERCDVERASICMERLRTSVAKGEDGICQLAEETKMCIHRVNIDCDVEKELMLSQMLTSIQAISSIACYRPVEEPVDADGCLENLAIKMHALLNYGFDGAIIDDKVDSGNADDDDDDIDNDQDNDQDSDGDDDNNEDNGDGYDGSENGNGDDKEDGDNDNDNNEGDDNNDNDDDDNDNDDDGENDDGDDGRKKRRKRDDHADETNSKEKSASSDKTNKTPKSGSTKSSTKGTDKQSSKASDTKSTKGTKDSDKSTKSDSMKSGKSSNELVNSKSREYQDNVADMCREVEMAWMCVEDSLNVLDRQTRSVLTVLLHAMKVAVDEKCKVHHCHSCSDLSENEVCNAQPKCPCPSHQQMCYTKLEDGMLTKGCSETCEECEGKEDCYCCVGDKCNMDDSKDPDDKCDVYTAISCAFELFTITVETEEITYSAVQGKLECVLEHTKDCKSESFRQIYTICLGIVDLFQVGECVSEYGDPLCGTSAILSLGYLMRNKFADKIIICSQYEATLTAIDNVIDDEICSADNLLPITSSLDFVTSQLTGYCVPADDEAGVCEIDMAISECIQAKSWRVPADASECSDAMLEAFKQCCITYTKGCNSMQRSGIFLHVQRHLDLAWLNCPDDVITTDLDQLRAEIFLVDDYSQITYSYSEFVLKLQQAMFGSLNFNKDACQILDELQTSLAEMEQPALLKLYTQLDVESILENLEEICKDTEIGEEAVVEECQQKQLDIMLIMDGSRSIKAENFPKMKEFAVNVVKLADLESGAVRIGCVQFAELMHHQFYLNDFLEEKDGKMVQSKEKMIDFIENMVYEDNWQTNTGGALQEARTKYLTEEYGARPGTPRHILLMTDGRSKGGPDVTVEAAITRDQGIHIFTVGIRLRGKEALEEMNAIASPPASLNFLNLDDFEQLDEFYTNIFLWLCRVDTPSECDFDSIVYTLSETMMLSFTTSFSQYEDKAAICSAVQVSTTSIESLSATCAPYQIKAIEVMQAIISALNLKTCLVVTEEEAPSRPCDKKKVDECIRMSINIFSHRAIEDESVCSIVSYLTQCVDHYGAQCEDKTSIMKEIAFFTSLTWNRCPEELGHLQCWGQVVDEGDNEGANEGSEGDDQSCDLVTIATGCLVGIDTNTALDDLDFLNPCGPLVQTVDNVMTCAKDAIMTSSCDRDVFDDFMPYIMEQKEVFRGMYEAAEKLGCSVIPVELPEEYGRVEPPTCAVIRECDVMMMKDCIDGLADLSGDDCGSLESVQQCIMHVQDCNSIEYMVLMSQLRSTLMERGFSEDCLDGSNIEWRNPDGYSDSLIACVDQLSSVIKEGTKTTCEIYSEFYTCLSPILADMSGMDGLFYFGFLYYDFGLYCDGFEADTDPDVDTEDCMVDESDVTCIAQYTEVALTGPALSKWSRMELCNKFRGRLECAENIRSDCPRGTPAHRLWEIYQVTEIIVYEADICTDTPLECYPNAAMLFVSKLAETVSLHNYGSVNTEQVCRQLTVTREHLRRFLNFCGHETTGFVMATFKEIECLALDICITGGFNPEEPEEEVAECIDRNIVTGDYECDLYGVFDHLHDFWLTNGEWPFLSRSSRRTATCSDLSRIMPGVYDLINNCGPIETSLVDGLAHDLSRIMPGVYDLINNCGPIETSLVDGLAHDLSRIMPGVYDLINNCGPIETSLVDGLAHDLSRIMPGVYGLINNCGPTETSLVDGLAHDLSRIMPGVYGLINNCGPIETSLVDGLAQYAIDYAHEEGCQIEFKTPCVEEPDCGVSKARACITEFTSNLEIYIGEGAQRVCIEQDAVRRCIDASIETCSDRVKVEIEAEYSEMLTDTVCQDNFGACATKYIHYLYKILDWKAYAETEHPDEETPDTDSESTPKSDTKETGSKKSDTKETGSKKSDTKETGSKKSDTKETGSKKSDTKETGSKKSDTKETGSKKSDTKETGSKKSDTKETGSKKSDTKETGSKKSDTKETGSKKSDTKETGSKKSDTKETGSKKSDTKETGSKKTETPKTEKEVVDPERKKKLDGYCQQFELAWTCVQENWGSVGESARGFVEFSFGLYHELAMDICNGPRPGYCKITGDSVQIQGCTYDDDCGYGTQKCCKYGPGSVCVEPETTPEDCYSVFIAAVQSSVTLVQSLYENDDNGVLFCSLHSQIIEGVYSSLTIDVCPMEYTNAVFAIMAFSVEKQILFCTVPPEPPKTCIEVDMQACINTYLAAVDGVTVMQDKCSAYAVLETCVSGFMSKCDNTIEEDIIIMQSINAELTSIRTNPQSPLFCANMPSFQMSISSSTIVVKEGNMPGTDIGIKPEQNPAEICEGQGQTCEFKITYEIVENEDDMPMCSQGTRISQLLLGDFCDILFTIDNWEVEQNVTLTARIDGKIDGDVTVTLKMFVTLIVDSIEVQTVPIREYTVIVEDRDTGSICSTTNDPHVSTFDGYDFDNHMQGEFVLYKHAVLPFEVRVFYVPCFDDQSVTATCICGVSVICDDDTFVLARCYGRGDERSKLTQWPNLPLMPGFRVVKNNDGHVFNAWFPTGTRVKITLETPTLSSSIDFLNVYVYPSAVDFGQTVGLCGLYDGEKSNDLVCSDGSQKNIDDYPPVETPDSPKLRPRPDEFSDCWKVPLEDFSFEGVPASITPTELPRYCTRSGVDPDQICTCGVEDFVEQCEFQDGEDVTVSTRLGATLNKRRKRNTGSIIEGINVDINAAPPPVVVFPVNGITYAMANQTCYSALTNADFAGTCSSVLVPTDLENKVLDCVSDILYSRTLETDFIRTAVEAYREQCVAVAVTNTNTSLVQEVVSKSCRNGCSGNGNCTNGTCICNEGFVSDDCSLNINDPPQAVQLDDGLCTSLIQDACLSVRVEGNNFVRSAFCHFEQVQVTESGIVKSGNQTSVAATFDSFEEVICDVSSSGSLPLHAVLVSVSNNNGPRSSQSQQHLFLAHDPICWNCTLDGMDSGSCTRARASCLIDGVCYRPTDPKQDDPCYLCDALTGTMVYVVSDSCPAPTTTSTAGPLNSQAREMNDSTVIGISAGIAGFVLVVFVIVVTVLVIRHLNKKKSDTKSLTERSRSSGSNEDHEGFQEVVFPGYPNYGYYGYGQDMYIEAPAEMFAGGVPKRSDTRQSSSRNSDPTYQTSRDGRDHRRSRNGNRSDRH